jgi:hypothetical protein
MLTGSQQIELGCFLGPFLACFVQPVLARYKGRSDSLLRSMLKEDKLPGTTVEVEPSSKVAMGATLQRMTLISKSMTGHSFPSHIHSRQVSRYPYCTVMSQFRKCDSE